MIISRTRDWLLFVARRSLGNALLRQARTAVVLGHVGGQGRPDDPVLDLPARVFVSWHDGPSLVGCIGTLDPFPRLEAAVCRYAVEAGLCDPRTAPLRADRLHHARCEISLLGEPRALPVVGLAAIARALVPGRQGVTLAHGQRRAFFLPVVWQAIPDPADFLVALCRKAGLDPRADGSALRAEVLDVESFGEDDGLGYTN